MRNHLIDGPLEPQDHAIAVKNLHFAAGSVLGQLPGGGPGRHSVIGTFGEIERQRAPFRIKKQELIDTHPETPV